MVDIEVLKKEIVERLKPLEPDKIILFGSYANATATEESDVDLFLLKDGLAIEEMRSYRLQLQKRLIDLQRKYLLGIDLFVDSTQRVHERIVKIKDQFYSEIMRSGKVIYGE